MEKALVMHENDNTATAIRDLNEGETVSVLIGEKREDVRINEHILFGHKFAIRPISGGEQVIKYGASIGLATDDITTGMHVHSHNLEGARGRGDRK
ncbi:MAG: UxaA family hydrolase [Deltaproteobacteria bacterium]|nr:UxaA family hydrolase [Deltaproteobacteria bacterium]